MKNYLLSIFLFLPPIILAQSNYLVHDSHRIKNDYFKSDSIIGCSIYVEGNAIIKLPDTIIHMQEYSYFKVGSDAMNPFELEMMVVGTADLITTNLSPIKLHSVPKFRVKVAGDYAFFEPEYFSPVLRNDLKDDNHYYFIEGTCTNCDELAEVKMKMSILVDRMMFFNKIGRKDLYIADLKNQKNTGLVMFDFFKKD